MGAKRGAAERGEKNGEELKTSTPRAREEECQGSEAVNVLLCVQLTSFGARLLSEGDVAEEEEEGGGQE